jgi:uncharacterized coiled-coil DUF342 family protein
MSECDISKDKAWNRRYHCSTHSVSFWSGSDSVESCPAGEIEDECEKEYAEKVSSLESEIDKIRTDRAGWAARSQEQFDRIGVALDSVRQKRSSGEPARDDATEIECLVGEVNKLKNDVDEWRERGDIWEVRCGDYAVKAHHLKTELQALKAERYSLLDDATKEVKRLTQEVASTRETAVLDCIKILEKYRLRFNRELGQTMASIVDVFLSAEKMLLQCVRKKEE